MKKKLNNIFQYICISYTTILIVTTLTNICINGLDHSTHSTFLLEIFFLLVVYWGIELLTDQINIFQKISPIIYVSAHIFVEYIVFLLFAALFNWYSLCLKNLFRFTLTFILIEIIVRSIFYHKIKIAEEEINRLITDQNISQH